MKTITSDFQAELNSQAPVYVKTLYLSQRSWSGTGYVYLSETDIGSCLLEVSTIKGQLDREGYAIWRNDNCTVTLRNERNQFMQDNASGYFPSGTAISGSKIRVEAGVKKTDGTIAATTVFSGYIAGDPVYNTTAKTVSITLTGRMGLLENISAETISISVENEKLGDGPGESFTTAQPAAGIITAVRRGTTAGGISAAYALTESEYSVSGLNEKDSGATITLEQQLAAGESLWVSYLRWYTDKTIEWVAQKLCDTAGASADISAVTFSSEIENVFYQDTQTDWGKGTCDRTDTSTTAGAVQLRTIPLMDEGKNWSAASGDEGYWSTGKYAATYMSPSGSIITPSSASIGSMAAPAAYGTWDFSITASGDTNEYVAMNFHFIASTSNPVTTCGYCLRMSILSGSSPRFFLYRVTSGVKTLLWQATPAISGTTLAARISRDSGGSFRLWLMSLDRATVLAQGIIATDTTYSSSSTMLAQADAYKTTIQYPMGAGVSNIKITPSVATGTGDYESTGYYISPVIDGGTSLSRWGTVNYYQNANSGTAQILYRVSADASTWGSWTEISNGSAISGTGRYLQMKWSVAAVATQVSTPYLYSWRLIYYTTSPLLPVVNMSGLSCKDGLEQLSRLCCYEMGFSSEDRFFFRPRTTSSSAVAAFDGDSIIEAGTVTHGLEKIYNSITVKFGDSSYTADSTSMGDTAPTSIDKYGERSLTIESENLMPQESANLAKAVAPSAYRYLYRPKRMAKIKTRFLPHIEPGDRITVTLPENSSMETGCKILYGVSMKIEGIELDMQKWTSTFSLSEILA